MGSEEKEVIQVATGGAVDGNTRTAPFPRLRTAYLREVAYVWSNPEGETQLRSTGEGGLKYLEDKYKFIFGFNIRFQMKTQPVEKRPKWTPNYTTGWFGHGDEFEIWLPDTPSNKNECVQQLARYGQEFPSMLGRPVHGSGPGVPDDFAEFGVITTRLIAFAWADSQFRDLLFKEYSDDARGLVQDTMDYVVKWNFKLKIKKNSAPPPLRGANCSCAEFYAEQHKGCNNSNCKADLSLIGCPAFSEPGSGCDTRTECYWHHFPRTVVTVFVPMAPESGDGYVEAAALGAYNDTGEMYPFTCA